MSFATSGTPSCADPAVGAMPPTFALPKVSHLPPWACATVPGPSGFPSTSPFPFSAHILLPGGGSPHRGWPLGLGAAPAPAPSPAPAPRSALATSVFNVDVDALSGLLSLQHGATPAAAPLRGPIGGCWGRVAPGSLSSGRPPLSGSVPTGLQRPAGLDASRCLSYPAPDTSSMEDGEDGDGDAHEAFAMSPRAGSPCKEATAMARAFAPAKPAPACPSTLSASLSGSRSDGEGEGDVEGWSHRRPGGPLEFLSAMRQKVDPTGAVFLDFVRILAHNPKPSLGTSPLRARVWALMHATGASSKFVLRKLTSAVLPGRGKAKQGFIREVLLLPAVPTTEQQWTKEDCVRILEAVCERAPQYARIPTDLRTRQAATTGARRGSWGEEEGQGHAHDGVAA